MTNSIETSTLHQIQNILFQIENFLELYVQLSILRETKTEPSLSMGWRLVQRTQ